MSLPNYEEKISYLEQLINNVQTNVTFTVSVVIAVLGVAVAIAGVALYLIAKSAVSTGIEKGIQDIDRKILKIMSDNPPYHHARGNGTVQRNAFVISGLSEFNFDLLVSLEVFNRDGKELARNIQFENDSITVRLLEYDVENDGPIVYWNVVWRNKFEIT